ncbi:MAG: type II secretion system GspH family protein [Verrucomicrobiales bacterium]|nr:type II secretion system GspH family protein [Verrucomicrobiales bacterium]
MRIDNFKERAGRFSTGFTLVELMVTIGIIALLLAVSAPLLESFRAKARKAKCISHLRTIHSGLLGYTTDKGHWPQMEEDRFDFDENEFFEFWVTVTEPYGVSRDTWVCPSDKKLEYLPKRERDKYIGSYVTTRFDDKAQTPFRWNQPWVMERGNFHGKGSHMLLPDGSVHDTSNPFYGR